MSTMPAPPTAGGSPVAHPSSSPPPSERIGDAERDQACELLQIHFEAGRLDVNELDGRLTGAIRAKTHADLSTLLDDLPCVRPRQPVVLPRRGWRSIAMQWLAGASIAFGIPLLFILVMGSGIGLLFGVSGLGLTLIGTVLAGLVSGASVWLAMHDPDETAPPRSPSPE